ncbi:MAG: pyridoxal kinase, partial [Pseudomonadota bacterium]
MSLAAENTVKPAIIVISSHVIRGSVGNRAAVFALEAFGFRVWVVPTVTLPWHPGHGPATQLVHDDTQFHSAIEDLTSAHWLSEVGAVLTGYMANASQVSSIAYLIKCVRAKNPDLVYLCDPVIGDADTLYVPEDIAVSIRDLLLPMGDISTPNRFELSWLTGKTT